MNGSSDRVTEWPLETDEQRAAWDRWSVLISAARHPSLARVVSVGRTETVGTLVLADPDSEDVLTWAGRTRAGVPERMAVLRAAASALDALHAGVDAAGGLAHGNLDTETVRVHADGSTVVVGFAPWTPDDPFRAPELRPGGPATRAGDLYAFARTVAEVLGGPGARDSADVGDLVRALRASPDTRRRARLIRAVQAALTGPAEARTGSLTAWLAQAIEGTAATEVRQDVSGPTPVVITAEPDRAARTSPTLLAVVVTAAVAAVLGVWVISAREADRPTTRGEVPERTVAVTADARWADACGSDSGIAGEDPTPELQDLTDADRLDAVVAAVPGGRWHTGRLLVTLRGPSDGRTVTITRVRAEQVIPRAHPLWRTLASTDCSDAATPDLRYALDLDDPRLKLDVDDASDRFGAFGPGGQFYLSGDPVTLAIDATACLGNYAWRLKVEYQDGDEDVTTLPVDRTFYTYGQARDTRIYELGTGLARPTPGELMNGSDGACG